MFARPHFALASLGAAFLVFSGCAGIRAETGPVAPPQAAQAAKRPNVLFILVDDLRPDIRAYGNPIAQTPNMDALAASGLLFERAYTQQAVCAPSRAALMTGLRPDTTGIKTLKQPVSETVPDAVTLNTLFKRAGYETLSFGKIYHHRGDSPEGWTKYVPSAEYAQRQSARKAKEPKLAAVQAEDRAALSDTVNANNARKELRRLAKSDTPFFLAVGIHKPHLPFVSPKADWARYDRASVPPPVNPEGQKGAPSWALVSYEIWNYEDTKKLQPDMPADKTAELRHAYLAAVSYADSIVGDLLTELKAQGLEDDTIVVLWGDHGWKLGDHNKWAKHSNAELDIHIPLMIRVPGVTKAGSRSAALVETVDVYPTLAELAGIQTHGNLEGLSMRPLLANPQTPWKQAAFAQFDRNGSNAGGGAVDGHTVRNARYRYTAWTAKRDGKMVAQELYDHQTDPAESTNLAKDKAHADALREMEAIRTGGWKKVRDAVR